MTAWAWGKNWTQQRKAALERDKHECQVCHRKAVSVHHIIPRYNFIGHMEDANPLSNLITLCRTHHVLVERGKVPCPTAKP